MKKRFYHWLIMLHPPQFRRRFGGEILCIFDESGAEATRALLRDGVISLLRQWAFRSEFPVVLTALLVSAVYMTLAYFIWLATIHRMVAALVVPSMVARSPQEAGMFLLLAAGLIAAIIFGTMLLAIWCIRSCAGKGGKPGRTASGAGMTARGSRVLAITSTVAICLWNASLTRGQSAIRPEFEVASVKLNTTGCANGRGGGRGGAPATGMLSVKCITLPDLIQAAYGSFANGANPNQRLLKVVGAPAWAETDTYDIDAKPAGTATIAQMYGPMLQGLLEDRFKLKIHREMRELPVYVLTIAKSGLRLQTSKEGSCTPLDLSHLPAQGQPAPVFCGRTSFTRKGDTRKVDGFGLSMATFAGTTLSARLDLDRPVIDKTGLDGIFDIHLEFAAEARASGPAEAGPGALLSSVDSGPSLFTALQEQLGLKLSPDKGPVDVLVVDGIERPSGN